MPELLPYGENVVSLSYGEARECVFRFSSMDFNLGAIVDENEDLALRNDQVESEVLPGIFLKVAGCRPSLLPRLRRRKLMSGTRISISVRNRRWHCSRTRQYDNVAGCYYSFSYESSIHLQPIVASSVPIQNHLGAHCCVRILLDSCGLTDESLPYYLPDSQAGNSSCRFRLISYSEAIESLLRARKLRAICEKDPSRYCVALWESLKNGTVANSDLFPVHVSHNSDTGVTCVIDGNHRLCCTRVFGGKNGKIHAMVDTCSTSSDTDFDDHIEGEGCFSTRRFRVSSMAVMRLYFQLLHNLHLDHDEGGALLDASFESLPCWIDGFL